MNDAELERLIAAWAAGHAPDLLARAQSEALEAARQRLRDRLAAALLEAAEDRMAGHAAPQPRAAASPEAEAGSALWVYGVIDADAGRPAAEGIDGAPLDVVRHAGLAAVVSPVPLDRFDEDGLRDQLEDLDRLEALARAHDEVLHAGMATGAIVPFRLCTIYASAEGLEELLERERARFADALRRLDGMEEWGVKAFEAAAAGLPREPVADAPESGREYIARKRDRREAAERERGATEARVAEVHARLAERAAAATLSRPHDKRLSERDAEMVLNAAYLVPREAARGFRELVERLDAETEGLDLEPTGPWPPYHFVEVPA